MVSDYSAYLKNISFRFYHPMSNLHGFGRLSGLLRRFGLSLEALNTVLPEAAPAALRGLLDIARMSTYAMGALINRVALMPEATCLVNVGVWHGFTFLSGLVGNPDKVCVGVDNFSQFEGPREEFLARFEKHRSPKHRFYAMDYEEYFAAVHREPIGFYVYDGEHSYENQLEGLQAAEPFFAPGCHVLVDDTNFDRARRATLDFIEGSSKNYDIVLDRPTLDNRHPTFRNGVMVLKAT